MDKTLRILMVEDVANDAELIQNELRKANIAYLARRVETRGDFLKQLAAFEPDVILADYSLPQFTGLEALRSLREQKFDTPFILVTGSQSEEVAVECMKEGADDYILKASLKRLPSAIFNTLKKKAAEHEKEKAEAALRRSEEQYRLITENTRDLICLVDNEGNFIYASPSFTQVLGYAVDELLGRNFFSLIHPADVGTIKSTFQDALLYKEGRMTELQYCHKDGDWRMFESAASWIFDEDGNPQRAVIVSRDISERMRAENEIQKLAAFPRFNPNPILAFAADGALTYFNSAAREMAKSLGKEHPSEILPPNTSEIVRACLATGQNKLSLETVIRSRRLVWSFFPIVAAQVVHCYAEDITDRLNLEEQLRQSQKMESVGQLAAGVAHDFNNILTIIQGHTGLLLSNASFPREVIDSMNQVSVAAGRAANLTRQLLTFSRKQIMQPQRLDLNEVISNVAKMLHRLLGEHIAMQFNYSPNLPAINADAGMIEQVIVNLAVNARDAMPKGGSLTISARPLDIDKTYASQHPDARAGRFVCLSVSDTGCGIDPATLSRIFEPFFTTKEVGKGTGLGLATVYGIVKQHAGWIEVDSKVGQGTVFKIFLPACLKSGDVTSEPPSPQRKVRGGTETILVVEDEPALRELVRVILQRYGYTVLEAASGVHALNVWKQHADEIDLLLTDMMMPDGIMGKELAEKLRADKPGLKVIYTSGYSVDAVGQHFMLREGVNFLQKPYHPPTLAQAVRDGLDGRAPVPAGPPENC
jgi:two-component system cell cycle sensor histidine kinase/response regulator CckA